MLLLIEIGIGEETGTSTVNPLTPYLGREVRYKDREEIARLRKQMGENDYRLHDAALELVSTKSFIER